MIPAGWADLPFWHTDWPRIQAALQADPRVILPPEPQRFAALTLTPPDQTRVVILGQDPYHQVGKADGLSFSIPLDFPPRRRDSLAVILNELAHDIGQRRLETDLSDWANQGVLMLNTALTVPQDCAGGHKSLGWSLLAQQVLAKVSRRPCAFMLWGVSARRFRRFIPAGGHLVIESDHPSPLATNSNFVGSRPFSRVNDWLIARNDIPIRWGAQP